MDAVLREPCRRRVTRWPVATLVGGLAALLLFLSPAAVDSMEWQRGLGLNQPWRLFTSHLAHFSTGHFLWDWVLFVLLGSVCELHWPKRTRVTLFAAGLAIPIAVWVAAPEITSYRGLSGLGSGLLALLALRLPQTPGFGAPLWKLISVAACLGLGLKIWVEFQTQSAIFVGPSLEFVPVPSAHLAGACAGAISALLPRPGRLAKRDR